MAIREERLRLQAGGHELAATLMQPETLIPGVLFVHGWGGSQQQYLARARRVAALGCICLTFDLGGHAETASRQTAVSRESNLADLLAAYDRLAAQPGVDPAAMAVVGSSYGGYLASILTTLRPVKWLALRVPALYVDDGWELPKLQLHREHDLVSYRRRLVAAAENRALQACTRFDGDVLLIESEFDTIVPHPVIQSYQEACAPCRSLTYRVIRGADHGLGEQQHQQAYTTLLVNWVEEMLAGAREVRAEPAVAPAAAVPETPPETAGSA